MKTNFLAPQIEHSILLLRSQKVMLSHDLSRLYGVETGALNRAVQRNVERFPEDFMFQLSREEWEALRCQIGILKDERDELSAKRGQHLKFLPYAFTEQGVAMLSSVLRSPRAVQVNVAIMRAFVRLRELLLTNADLAKKLDAMEKKYDGQFKVVFDALRQLMTPAAKPPREIGFHAIEKARARAPSAVQKRSGKASQGEADRLRAGRARR